MKPNPARRNAKAMRTDDWAGIGVTGKCKKHLNRRTVRVIMFPKRRKKHGAASKGPNARRGDTDEKVVRSNHALL